MIATPPPALPLRQPSPLPPSLLSRFQGAIAGAILGYLIGHYYSGEQGLGMRQSYPLTQTLDLRWLSNPITQTGAVPVFYPSSLSSSKSDPKSDAKPDARPGSKSGLDAGIDLSAVPLLKAMVTMLDICRTQGYACQDYADQDYADQDTETQIVGSIPKNGIQAALVLLPLLLLYHENPPNQQRAIAQILPLWPAPSSWEPAVTLLGATLSTALLPNLDPRTDPASLNPSHSAAEFICHSFWCQPHSYEMGLMTLINQEHPFTDAGDLPTIAANLGALLGGYGGFSALPLRWQYALNQPMESPGITSPPPDSTNAASRFQGKFQASVKAESANVLSLKTLMHQIVQLVARWSGISQINPSDGNPTVSSLILPTVIAPRTLALD